MTETQTGPLLDIMLRGDRDGSTYQHDFDFTRLNRQARAVYLAMSDGEWRTLAELEEITNEPQASISARIRDLRKRRFNGGKFTTERRRRPGMESRGVFEYRIAR